VKSITDSINKGKALGFVENKQGVIRFQNQICVSQERELKERIKAKNTRYFIHPRGMKCNKDLRQTFWWNNRDIAKYVSNYLTC